MASYSSFSSPISGHFSTFFILGLDHDAFTEYGDRDIMTLPRDRTLGHGEGVPYGVPEQPGAYMSRPTDVSIR